MRSLLTGLVAGFFLAINAPAQILMSGGTNYSQNFDTLAASGTGNPWTNNDTLPGWYAAKAGSGATVYIGDPGTSTTGGLHSYGTNGVNSLSDRALGSLGSGSANPVTFGLRFTNDTDLLATNITVTFTGEQWRDGGSGTASTLTFSYAVSASPITNSTDAAAWVDYPALDFTTPTVGTNSSALDGNNATNRQVFSNVLLAGVTVRPGEELFLRWRDEDDAGSDGAFGIDDLTVGFETTANVIATNPPVALVTNNSVTLMTYNVKGNGALDWSTNTVQVQAIGRELRYLQPDIITFNEIPYTETWQMTNWVTAFMPGYYLAINSGTDGSIRSVIASRFPINRSKSWLAHVDLNPYGYTNTNSSLADNFTRDLFEAEIAVPGWPQPWHVFTTHLKATSGTTYADAAAKRAAEAAAITNFIATNMLALYPLQPFTLSGDMNETDTNQLSIQRLISPPATLHLTDPANPATGKIFTYDSVSPSGRIDYIFPCALLFSNIISSQVFRTDKLPAPLPPDLYGDDSQTASDHLPVLMTFANPFAQPFRITAFGRSDQGVSLQWQSVPGGVYCAETSADLISWAALAPDLLATNYTAALNTNAAGSGKYFRLRTQ
jgi:endonuclease/exonuclease/phosphatase family metal-dependent hydrolase